MANSERKKSVMRKLTIQMPEDLLKKAAGLIPRTKKEGSIWGEQLKTLSDVICAAIECGLDVLAGASKENKQRRT